MRVPPTTEGAAGVDAHGPHVGLIGVADTVVEGDEDAGGREQKTKDQQAQNQGVQGQWRSSDFSQHGKHCTRHMKIIFIACTTTCIYIIIVKIYNITFKRIKISEGRTKCSGYSPIEKIVNNQSCSIEEAIIGSGTVHGGLGPVCGQSIPQHSHSDGGNQRAGQEVYRLLAGRHGN